jgi:hypothetical protein
MTVNTFSIFQGVLLLAPALIVAVSSWLWWPTLGRPWLFLAVGLIVLYLVAAAALVWVLMNVGISGRSGAPMLTGPPQGLSSATKALVGAAVLVVGGSAFLWILRRAVGVR